MPASESEFKGNPMIVLSQGPDDKFPFQFGLKKAKLILEHLEEIRKFVEKHYVTSVTFIYESTGVYFQK